MPQQRAPSTREEILRVALEFFDKSLGLRKEIEGLPIHFRDGAVHMAITPLLYEGKGITPRRIVVLRERVLHKLVKQYFRRQGYESYTDEELVIRKRRYEGGYGKEEYPTPDVFARKRERSQLVVAEVKSNVSANSVRDCVRKLTECLKFANAVYAAFRVSRPFSGKSLEKLDRELPDAGVLLVNPFRVRSRLFGKGTVKQIRPAKDHIPPDQKKWNEYYYHFDRARARSKRKRFISLRLPKLPKEKEERLQRWIDSRAPEEELHRILADEPDEWPD